METTAVETDRAPPRTMGLFGTALLPVNGMIGAGIFALPATLFLAVGDFAPWMMLLGGVLFLPLVVVFAWLSARFDHSGGPILYGEAAFGRFVGFQAGWARYASAIVTVAANTHVMVSYLATLFPALDGPLLRPLVVAGFIGFITVVNLFSLKSSVATLGALTAVKLLPLFALIGAGLFAGEPSMGLVLPEFSAAESIVLLTYYAFIGFEYVVLPAGEMKNPRRDVPLALVAMLAAVTLLYMLVIWAYIAIGPVVGADADNPLAVAARDAMGPVGAIAIVIAAAFSIGANNFAGGISLPRMTYGMAERGMLPRWFMAVSPRLGTPVNSILFYGAASIAFGLWEGFMVLALAGTLTRLLTYLIAAFALPVLEYREGRIRPVRALVCALTVVSTLWVATHADAQSWAVFGGLVVAGTLLYFLARQERPLAAAPL
jgi:amino acid transporter